MLSPNGRGERINSFALVSYLPDPLADYLNRLRYELAPHCLAKAHVTVLPPRPLTGSPDEAWQQMQQSLQDFQPFHVELAEVAIFPISQAIYIAIKSGAQELGRMHSALNVDGLAFDEPFEYRPHLTLAQDLPPEQIARGMELAAERWGEFPYPRGFTVDRLTFVQNTLENLWADLAAMDLASHVTT
jgi:2'-5' RNA ligase